MSLTEDRIYRMLVESISDYAIYMLDPTGIVSSWNPGARRFKGYTDQEIIGRHFGCFYTVEEQAADLPSIALAAALDVGKFEGEGWRVRKDGKPFWAHVVIAAVYDATGAHVGFAKITRDLSERRLNQESFERSSEDFNLLIQSLTDCAIYMLDPQGLVTHWPVGAQRIKGYVASEILGQHFARFYTAEDQAAGEPARALAAAVSQGHFESEGWRVRRDGRRFWANVMINPIYGKIGEVTGFVNLSRDFSQAKESRDALVTANQPLRSLNQAIGRSEARFRHVVEAAPNAMIMVNASGKIDMVNAQTERLFGYVRGDLLGLPIERLFPAKWRQQEPALRDVFTLAANASADAARQTLPGVTQQGVQVQVQVGLSPIETDEGTMLLAAIVDMTEHMKMEEQVRQSQKMHAMGRMTAGVAHDFNNLLLALSGSMELLVEAVDGQPAALEWGAVALRAIGRGKQLTDRLLSFSRKQLLVAKPVRIDTLFAELRELTSHLFEANTRARTQLVMQSGPPGLAVMADLAQLEAALINLVVNARDAMAAGGRLLVSAYAADGDPAFLSPGRYIVISTADTGSGMDGATLAQVFEPFFSTKGPNGTGLGLSMVQGFARQSGGDARITSVLGEGTTIDLWLPAADPPATAQPLPVTRVRSAGRVLVVDDSPDSLTVVAGFLRHAGIEVTERCSGAEALEALGAGQRFDALVTDFLMPGINGLELLRQAAQIDPSMEGMIITGYSDPDLLADLGDITVLRKPFNRAELTEAVRGLVAGRHTVTP